MRDKPSVPPDGLGGDVHWVFKQSMPRSPKLNLRADTSNLAEVEHARFEMALYVVNFMIFRETFLPSSTPDAHFNILIDLYISEQRSEPVSVTNICTAARVPQTTALRALQNLIDEDRIVRFADRHDQRRKLVALTMKARREIEAYIDKLLRIRDGGFNGSRLDFGPLDGDESINSA